ncbi:MAG: hydrogenase expression/formation protein HypE [Planctomycetes bacterium]|nr:hydrogenase expression/formation protein HypE [Planctomycetota bacterium]
MPNPPHFENWTCPLPLRDYPTITLAHGGGGRLSAELIEHLFLPAFADTTLSRLTDAAVLPSPSGRLAFTTDSFVVRPLFFPGGSIGELAVNGTVNDLAMSGAEPMYLTAAFVLEEGFAITELAEVVRRMANAARAASVRIVAGDTKVIERSRGDGCYITTSGIGVVSDGVDVGPDHAQPGDVVILSGTIGDHGMAVMSVREGLEFETTIESDTAPLHDLVREILSVTRDIRCLRDPTRGGLAATLNEIANCSGVGIVIEEKAVPMNAAVRAACEMLGFDPLHVANEGKLVAVVPAKWAHAVLARIKAHPLGVQAAVIGRVSDQHPGLVAARTALGGTRVVSLPLGEQLPRIC